MSLSAFMLGDIDGDSDVTPNDDKLFKEYFAGKDVPIHYFNADINGDDSVTRKDAMILARYLANWGGYSLGGEVEKLPWDESGSKQPIEYTYAEFEALTAGQQMAFQNSFGSYEAFDAWLQKALYGNAGDTEEDKLPWEVPGAKQPIDYTYAEFENLTASQQMAFQNSFGSHEAFDAWLQKALSGDTEEETLPWEVPDAKQPIDYSYAEFEYLTASQQIAFQNSFGNFEAFDAWLQKALSGDVGDTEDEKLPWEVFGAKQPEEYIWDEFIALYPGQQIAFQSAFMEADGFEKWLEENEP